MIGLASKLWYEDCFVFAGFSPFCACLLLEVGQIMDRSFLLGKVLLVACCGLLLLAGMVFAVADEKRSSDDKKKIDHKKAFAIFKQKCLQCHDSVADPEKPGRTKDEWLLVLKTMHGYGLGLTPQETELVGGLLYDLRRGVEKDPG